jgi:hypothetical protein
MGLFFSQLTTVGYTVSQGIELWSDRQAGHPTPLSPRASP